ncbi:unnamed protein product, partial [Laminaria digitata]
MSRACTLLACGWSLQSWGTEGFAGMASGGAGSWRPSGGGTVRPRPKTTSSSCAAAAAAGWQRRPPRRVLGDYCDVSVACRQARAASTLEFQEDGAVIDEGSNSDEGVDGSSSSSSSAAAAAAGAAASKPSKKGR